MVNGPYIPQVNYEYYPRSWEDEAGWHSQIWIRARALSLPAEGEAGHCAEARPVFGYRRTRSVLYPYVFVVVPNKHHVIWLLETDARNSNKMRAQYMCHWFICYPVFMYIHIAIAAGVVRLQSLAFV